MLYEVITLALVGDGVGVDDAAVEGNVFALTPRAGVAVREGTQEFVISDQNLDEIGTRFCSPAVVNSTGQPGVMTVLGIV